MFTGTDSEMFLDIWQLLINTIAQPIRVATWIWIFPRQIHYFVLVTEQFELFFNEEGIFRSSIYTGRPMTAWLDMPAMLINNADMFLSCSLSLSITVLIYTIIFFLKELRE